MAARPTRLSCALLLAASLFTPAPARADVDDEFTLVDEAFDPDQQDAGVFTAPKLPEVRLRAEVRGVYDQDFGSADVSSLRSGGVLRLLWPLSRRVVLGFIAGSEVEVFDFDGNKRFLNTGRTSGDPFDNLTATQFRIGGRYVVNEDWSINVVGFCYLPLRGGRELSGRRPGWGSPRRKLHLPGPTHAVVRSGDRLAPGSQRRGHDPDTGVLLEDQRSACAQERGDGPALLG
ncbi:MAG: hypothetical protein IH974_11210 [Myxococcales bacterium]|nr:hypothetical protein [Myxococcales bacterium]